MIGGSFIFVSVSPLSLLNGFSSLLFNLINLIYLFYFIIYLFIYLFIYFYQREYKEALKKGHGAYLMEEKQPDIFQVKVCILFLF